MAEVTLAAHRDHVAVESRAAAENLDALAAFGQWTRRAQAHGAALSSSRAELDRIEAAGRDALRAALLDTRRIEQVRDAAVRAARRAANRRHQARDDERAATRPPPDRG